MTRRLFMKSVAAIGMAFWLPLQAVKSTEAVLVDKLFQNTAVNLSSRVVARCTFYNCRLSGSTQYIGDCVFKKCKGQINMPKDYLVTRCVFSDIRGLDGLRLIDCKGHRVFG